MSEKEEKVNLKTFPKWCWSNNDPIIRWKDDFEAKLRAKSFEIEIYDINMVLRKHKVVLLKEILGE